MKEKHNVSSLRQLYKFMMAGITLVLAISSLTTFTYADSINPGVFSIHSEPYGTPYKEWIIRWWQWHMSIPTADHPRNDFTGEKCAVGQEGLVWFLNDHEAGKKELTCTMPAGKAILFATLTGECDYGTEKNDEEVRECATAGNEYGTISVTIDGVQLQNPKKYRIQSDFFNITIPKDNIYGTNPGTFRAMVDGFFVFLEPLPAGRHDIHFTVIVLNPVKPQYNHAKDITYHLIVKPP